MITVLASLLPAAALILPSAAAPMPSAEQTQRIAASFVLALGRAPSAGELAQYAQLGPLSIADLIARLRERLANDPAARRATWVSAGEDAFGRAPGEDGPGLPPAGTGTYFELMQRHVAQLAGHPAEYEQVLRRAYQFLLRRDAYPDEIDYWKRQDPLPYALVVDWPRRNQPGLMVTGGTATICVNSDFLSTVRLAPEVAAEARAAAGLPPAADAENHLVAAGAAHVASRGGMHLVTAGTADLRSARAGDP